ncbi:MAG: sugar phosphate isomerase/epimerase [Planctomycetia bacterium]|nr:sugar phosphate isomerase/epimerase [Planctomycetia bacterium]
MLRRTFLKTTALAALSFGSPRLFAQGESSKRVALGVQLYSVREAARKNLPATLKAIAKMGYEGVEFAGYYGNEPTEIRKMLDDCGLVCCGTHTPIGAFRGDNFEKTVHIHKTLGTPWMIVPGGIDKELHSVEGNKAIAEEFNKLSERATALGMAIGYHAHGGDAKLVEGIPAWERFFDATVSDVLMQMDIGNYLAGGGDPYKMIEKFPGRSKTIHVKDTAGAIIGSGNIDWDRFFKLSETIGGAQWYVVEDGGNPDSLDRIELCLKALKDMGK